MAPAISIRKPLWNWGWCDMRRPADRAAAMAGMATELHCESKRSRWFASVSAVLMVLLFCNSEVSAYSVLTHMEIVDLAWTEGIRPMLVRRFPNLSEDEITKAHAYAYGGSVIQDLGFYPFGSVEFSDLVHYVRSGDFVEELLRQSRNANDYAFALGA